MSYGGERLFQVTDIPTAALSSVSIEAKETQKLTSPKMTERRRQQRESMIAAGFYPALQEVNIIEVPNNVNEQPVSDLDGTTTEAV